LTSLLSASLALGGPVPRAAGASEAVSAYDNIPYGSSPLQVLDAFVPTSGSGPRPAVIFVHGGSWVVGDKSNTDEYAKAVAEVGWTGFSISYRFVGFPGEVSDVLSAVDWVRAHAAQYGVDPSNLALLGTSAGGNLVAEAATDAPAFGGSPAGIRAVVTWSGPMDLTSLVTGDVPPAAVVGVARYLGCEESACPARYAQASPITSAGAGSPPMLLCNSTNEIIPLSQATSMADKLQAAGVAAQVDAIPGNLHAAAYAPEAFPASINYLSKYLGPISGSVPPVNANGEGLGPVFQHGVPPRPSTTTTPSDPTSLPTTGVTSAASASPQSSSSSWLPLLVGLLGGAVLTSALWLAYLHRRRRRI
jgi:acetyl esterase/lipase